MAAQTWPVMSGSGVRIGIKAVTIKIVRPGTRQARIPVLTGLYAAVPSAHPGGAAGRVIGVSTGRPPVRCAAVFAWSLIPRNDN